MVEFQKSVRSSLVFIGLVLLTIIVYFKSFSNFFAQDDFILINYFSDFRNVYSWPSVSHFRPIHNLYFFVGGNLFGQNPIGYHLITLLIHVLGGFYAYRIFSIFTKSRLASFAGSIVYVTCASHFVSLFWISGTATSIGFLFFISSLYYFMMHKQKLSIVLFAISLLASEAMVAGLPLFLVYGITHGKKFSRKALSAFSVITILYIFIRLVFFTPAVVDDSYNFSLGSETLKALKYYSLRIVGFGEGSGFNIVSLALALVTGFVIALFVGKKVYADNSRDILLSFAAVLSGLFPFILIPNHLSAHYMNIAIFGFSLFVAVTLSHVSRITILFILMGYIVISFLTVQMIYSNHWVVKRANLANLYINRIADLNWAQGSTIVFVDNDASTSKEAYITLGQGQAINFFYGQKQYKACFTFIESCPDANVLNK